MVFERVSEAGQLSLYLHYIIINVIGYTSYTFLSYLLLTLRNNKEYISLKELNISTAYAKNLFLRRDGGNSSAVCGPKKLSNL
jgi:hypothetical protein